MAGPPLVDLRAFLSTDRVIALPGTPSKRDLLITLAELTAACPEVTDRSLFLRAIFEREEVTSTGIGGGIAIPHARLPSITGFVMSIGLCLAGVDYAARDQLPVRVVVMLAATERDRGHYLQVLAAVATRLKDGSVAAAMLAASHDPERVLKTFVG